MTKYTWPELRRMALDQLKAAGINCDDAMAWSHRIATEIMEDAKHANT